MGINRYSRLRTKEYAYVVMHGCYEFFSSDYKTEAIAVFATKEGADSYIAANNTKISKDPWTKEKLWVNQLPLNPNDDFRTL